MASAAVSDEGALRMRPTPCGCTSALLSGCTGLPLLRLHRNRVSDGPFCSALCRGRCPHRPSFPVFTGLPFLQLHCNCAFGDSSSQTPSDASLCIRSAKPIARRKACALGASRNPSPRRKRQVSSVPLLVLSKLQTLRWFAIWFCLSCQKKWAKRGA